MLTAVMDSVETVQADSQILAYLIRAGWNPETTTFVTPPESELQVGAVVYPAGGEVRAHSHARLTQRVTSRGEVLIVKTGRCRIDLFDSTRRLVCSRELERGDAILLLAGYHGVTMLEATVLFEIKQGPYGGIEEKEFL